MYQSRNFGVDFVKVSKVEEAQTLTFGKVGSGIDHPTVFIPSKVEGELGRFRSTNLGNMWVKINTLSILYRLSN